MSDALTDLATDERRQRRHLSFLDALCVFLRDPTESNKDEAISKAQLTDQVPTGFFGGRTSLSSNISVTLDSLRDGDKQVWAKLLFSLAEHSFQKMKVHSPFANQLLVVVDYGVGFVTLRGDVQAFLAKLIGTGKGWKTYDCDKYLVALPSPDPEKAEVFWVDCHGQKGPRTATD